MPTQTTRKSYIFMTCVFGDGVVVEWGTSYGQAAA